MIPLKDNNPTQRFPFVTVLLILANSLVFFYTDLLGFGTKEFIYRFAVVPLDIMSLGEASGRGALSALGTTLTSQFMHGGILHIVSNMLFLWIFGNNVEDRMGPIFFILFYSTCGVAAATAQVLGDPTSTIPMLGASGAVAGVMGAYLLMFPSAQVLTIIWIIFFVRLVWLPAYVIIIYWIIIQILSQLNSGSQQGGVAYLAHIGGFAAGIAIYFAFRIFSEKKGGHGLT
jgi:membrane associated rhomboid family serine protease